MENKSQNAVVTKNTYIAWSLHTGPANATPLWEDSRWITGKWNGVDIKSSDDIQRDIDARVDVIISSFCLARNNLSATQKISATNYFVIPEFYFHSMYGPYPNVKIGGKYPYEYILSSIREKLAEVPLLEDEVWVISIGTVMTCNVSDIPEFLESVEVKERLDALNNEIRKFQLENRSNLLKNGTHIKAMGYMNVSKANIGAKEEINSLMRQYRANPLCIVRNRGAVLKVDSSSPIKCYKHEKQNESTVDLTMGVLSEKGDTIEIGGMITEWLAGYPSVSIIAGDKNSESNPTAARMSIDGSSSQSPHALELGVEICLDHRLQRLRRTVEMTKENGADADNPSLDLQIITSGGMQILDESVVSGCQGAIFNADGCDPILDQYNSEGKPVIDGSGVFKGIACGVYISSAQTMREIEQKYYSHSQLSFRYGNQEIVGYDNAKGINNIKGATYDKDSKTNPILDSYTAPMIVNVPCDNSTPLYAAGLGELHMYISNNPDQGA